MIQIDDKEYDFSFGNPNDIRRWKLQLAEFYPKRDKALEGLEAVAKAEYEDTDAELQALDAYADACQALIDACTEMIDQTLGEGTSNQLFGKEVNNAFVVPSFHKKMVDAVNGEAERMMKEMTGGPVLAPVGTKGKAGK